MIKNNLQIIFLISFIFLSCQENSDTNQNSELPLNNKEEYVKSKNNLESDINTLESKNDSIETIYTKIKTLEEISNIISNSSLDHINIVVDNLVLVNKNWESRLGFNIKKGKQHKNGISNFFIEFGSSREFEFISVQNPNDKLAKYYSDLSEGGAFASINVNNLKTLENYYSQISKFGKTSISKRYSVFSFFEQDNSFPFFFINYYNNQNSVTRHPNGSYDISTVWLSVPNIEEAFDYFREFGFIIKDIISLPKRKVGVISLKNSQVYIFEEGEKVKVFGATILVENLAETMNYFDGNNVLYKSYSLEFKKRNSILISKDLTNGFELEFLEKKRN